MSTVILPLVQKNVVLVLLNVRRESLTESVCKAVNVNKVFFIESRSIHEKFRKWSRERFTYAQGFRVNAACTVGLSANNYTKDDVLRIFYACI